MSEARQQEIAEFCGRLRRLRIECGNPPLTFLSQHPLCPEKSQLSKIFRGQIRRLPDGDTVRGIVARCVQWAQRHNRQPLLSTDEQHWLIERDIVERRMDTLGDQPSSRENPVVAAKFALPRDLATFTGRHDQLAELIDAVKAAGIESNGMLEIQLIDGMPGVGKTVFAVHAAYLLADLFPDGQFFVDLHGHSQHRAPLDPADALEMLLLAVGVDPAAIPNNLDARAALWRDRMAGRTALLLLDNATSYDQISPLLPASPRCLVLVTSRRRLASLQDAHTLTLDVLPAAQAADLFTRLARPRDHDPGAIAELTRSCGYLPLAISLVASRLRHHPTWPLRHLVERVRNTLASARNRLGEFQAESLAVAAAFEMSYGYLPAAEQRLFRRLSLHAGPDIDVPAAAALDDADAVDTRGRLERLYDDHLLIEYLPGRYRFHDLIRLYAVELAAAEDSADNADARRRLLDHYVRAAAAATAHLPSYLEHYGAPITSGPAETDRAAALAWLSTEHDNLLAWAIDATWPKLALGLVAVLHPYLRLRGHFSAAEGIYRAALTGSDIPAAVRAILLTKLGTVQRLVGRYADARELAVEAREIFVRAGDQRGQAVTLFELAEMYSISGKYDVAREACIQAHEIYTALGHRQGQAASLLRLGETLRCLSRFDDARDTLIRGYEISTELGDQLGQAGSRKELGILQLYTDEYAAAIQTLDESYRLYVQLGDRFGQANLLILLGWLRRLTGDYDGARDALTTSYELCVDVGHRLGQANALNVLGTLRCVVGEYDGAHAAISAAHRLYDDMDMPFGRADSLRSLGALHLATGDLDQAQDTLAEAHRQFVALGDQESLGETLTDLGALHLATGDAEAARRCLTEARSLITGRVMRGSQAETLNVFGRVELAAGRIGAAVEKFGEALALAGQVGAILEQARAHEGLAASHTANGDHAQAAEHRALAEEIHQRLALVRP